MNHSKMDIQQLFDQCKELSKVDDTFFGDYELEDRTIRLAVTFSRLHEILIIRLSANLPDKMSRKTTKKLESIVEDYNSKNIFGHFRFIHIFDLNSVTYTINLWLDGAANKESIEDILQQAVTSIKSILYDIDKAMEDSQG